MPDWWEGEREGRLSVTARVVAGRTRESTRALAVVARHLREKGQILGHRGWQKKNPVTWTWNSEKVPAAAAQAALRQH